VKGVIIWKTSKDYNVFIEVLRISFDYDNDHELTNRTTNLLPKERLMPFLISLTQCLMANKVEEDALFLLLYKRDMTICNLWNTLLLDFVISMKL